MPLPPLIKPTRRIVSRFLSAWRVALAVLLAGLILDWPVPASKTKAAPISLSGPILSGDVSRFAIAPDDRTVIFTSDERVANRPEFYRVSKWGGEPVRLSIPLTTTKRLRNSNIMITADNRWIVYGVEHPQNVTDPYAIREIFRHPIDDSTPSVRLSHALSGDAYIYSFVVSRDGRYVVYRTCPASCEIFSVPVDGSHEPVKLNYDLPVGGTIWLMQLSRDSRWVVYYGEQEVNDRNELYIVPIEGPASAARKLNDPLPPQGEVSSYFYMDESSRWVFYGAPQSGTTGSNLFSVPVAGTRPSVPLIPANALVTDALRQVTPSGLVIYSAKSDPTSGSVLYSVPVDGPADARIQLSNSLEPDYELYAISGVWPGLQHVILMACLDCGSMAPGYAFYSVPLYGANPTSYLLAEALNEIRGISSTPAGQTYLYGDNSGTYAVPITGPATAATQISPEAGALYWNPGFCQLIIRTPEQVLHIWPFSEPFTDTVQSIGPISLDIAPYQQSFEYDKLGHFLVYMADNGGGHIELYAAERPSCYTETTYLPSVSR